MKNNRNIIRLEQTDSTNREALEMGLTGAAAGTVVVAETQTSGRGRLGKEWMSPPGTGLYFSIILRPRLAPNDLPKLTLAVGLAVCEALEQTCDLSPMLKWPNDILLADRKAGGILCESGPLQKDNDPVVVAGVGLNLSTPLAAFPEPLQNRATSLALHTDQALDSEKIMTSIVNRVETVLVEFEAQGFAPILNRWRKRDATLGQHLQWVALNGQVVAGVSLGPNDEGILRVQDNSGQVHMVLSGDINLAG